MEHPFVTQINKTGYPKNTDEQKMHFGIDEMGTEIFVGDSVVIADNDEIVLEENLEDYLIERLGFKFEKAE